MLKFVVLCVIFAAVAAKPGAQFSTIVAPASTSISEYDTSVIHPTPIISAPALAYGHWIKKRSPQLPLAYYTPSAYIGSSLVSSASFLPGVAPISPDLHLIKKRSAQLLSTPLFTPQVYSATAPLISSTNWLDWNTHLIKKRSAPLFNSYIAPAAYSHESRLDWKTSHTPLASISYSAPISYARNIAFSPLY